MSIRFTQYLRPNGRKKAILIDRPSRIEGMAARIARTHDFEAEVLTTGEVSLTVHDPVEGEDIAIKIIKNGPDVVKAVDALVYEAWDFLFKEEE